MNQEVDNRDKQNLENSFEDLKKEHEELQAAHQEMQEKLKEAQDNYLRAYAEMENTRLRAQRDVEKSKNFTLQSFVKDLLPALDSLEQAIEYRKDKNDGLSMIMEMFLNAFSSFNISTIDPKEGDDFDPQQHDALILKEDSEKQTDTISAVMQRGYKIDQRIIRAARVCVIKNIKE